MYCMQYKDGREVKVRSALVGAGHQPRQGELQHIDNGPVYCIVLRREGKHWFVARAHRSEECSYHIKSILPGTLMMTRELRRWILHNQVLKGFSG